MKSTFALALLSPIVASISLAELETKEFVNYAIQHGKNYKSVDEVNKRKGNWKNAKAKVENLNSNSGNATFAVNFTADLDDDEYLSMLGL
jgi:uncharacterized protein YxeA